MSLDMMHAFEAAYAARFSDLKFRAECESFSRGWVAARDADATTGVEAAFLATYRARIDDLAWALQAEAFHRGWQAWARFAAHEGRRLFCAGRAGVVRVRLHVGTLAPLTYDAALNSGNTFVVDPARRQALQVLAALLQRATPAPAAQEPA